MVTIQEMREAGVDLGKLVEVTLFQGAEFYDDYTPAPTVNPMGYDPSEEMSPEPGFKFSGYVHEMKNDHFTLAMGINSNGEVLPAWYGGNHFLHFHEKAIHSYRSL